MLSSWQTTAWINTCMITTSNFFVLPVLRTPDLSLSQLSPAAGRAPSSVLHYWPGSVYPGVHLLPAYENWQEPHPPTLTHD